MSRASVSYFEAKSGQLMLAPQEPGGLRRAQQAALYAAAAHCISRTDPGIVVMPTGSGKTAVMMALPYLVRPARVLYVTPSRLVRDQIGGDLKAVVTLKKLGLLSGDTQAPATLSASTRKDLEEAARGLSKLDALVVTPALMGKSEILEMFSSDSFDLLVLDEAHHAAAASWRRIVEYFSSARAMLFTATPVRRDRKRVAARLVYAYPLADAFRDGVFGAVRYRPVIPQPGESEDEAIALAAERVVIEDRGKGLDHRLLVRTDSKARADELEPLYREKTTLKLSTVHSGYSYRHVKKVLASLERGDLDGIIAVDMLGEGVDFPKLKTAAIHAPHRSLGVTLQFIGRFARTTDPTVGEATFLSTPNGIKHEAVRLYSEDAVWQRLIPNLADNSIASMLDLQTALDTFSELRTPPPIEAGLPEFSLYSVEPMAHVKLYQVDAAPDMSANLSLPSGFQVLWDEFSSDLDSRVVVTLQLQQPAWTRAVEYARREYDLHVLHYHTESGILFIASSRRQMSFYEALARSLSGDEHRILPLSRLNSVIGGMTSIECFNIGMRNRVRGASMESYRIMAGPHTERAVSETDGRLYHRGHLFLKGRRGDQEVVIGYSSSAKVWSSERLDLARLINWCDQLGHLIAHPGETATGSGLDLLEVGAPIDSLPPLIGSLWPDIAYRKSLRLGLDANAALPLLDADIVLAPRAVDDIEQALEIVDSSGARAALVYTPTESSIFSCAPGDGRADQLQVFDFDGEAIGSLRQFLANSPPSFFDARFSRYEGSDQYRERADLAALDLETLEEWDWTGVDIGVEFDSPLTYGTVQGAVQDYLQAGWNAQVILYDHRPGEAADFIALREEKDRVRLALVHCKASGGAKPGARVGDVYDLAGQASKSTRFCGRPKDLLGHIRRRCSTGSSFVLGRLDEAESLLESPKPVIPEIWLVQPGLSKTAVVSSAPVQEVLAAAGEYVRRNAVGLLIACSS